MSDGAYDDIVSMLSENSDVLRTLPLKQAPNRVTDERTSHRRGRPFLRPYPRTEPREAAQRRAFEGKQTLDLTPEVISRPPQ